MKKILKRLYFAINPSNRLVILDHPVSPKPNYHHNSPHKILFNQIAQYQGKYAEHLQYSLNFKTQLRDIKDASQETDAAKPTWNNGFVPGLDIIMLYTLLNYSKPARYIEIGSGTTTKVAKKAKTENDLRFTITCIDPNPRQEIRNIADHWYNTPVQNVSLELFSSLEENDIVFFDGSHMLLPNSDVMWFFMEILPILPRGVIIQVHDIYLPYDYPQFMCDRYYSENYTLGTVLANDPDKYEILLPNYYISQNPQLAGILNELWESLSPPNIERHGGSFWFRKK